MAKSNLHIGILLVIFCVADGQSTTSEDVHCSYTFNVPAADCSQTLVDDQLIRSLLIALQGQVKLLAGKQEELTEENVRLRQKIATIEADAANSNLKQCSRRGLNSARKYGLVYSCEFVKKRDDTVLRVVWNGDMRLINTGPRGASGRRWFFTINGQECSEPRTIDTELTFHTESTNIHRPTYVEGYCRGIAAGDVYVAWNVGDCISQATFNVGDSHTGWEATVRIIVEEVAVKDANTLIV
ncbi:hypothetical protein LSAT2_014724 [Lamellibrachia satsuma]|nr:hypothetical protein LSAT2_014724 [Lamellibrachia satsuma]